MTKEPAVPLSWKYVPNVSPKVLWAPSRTLYWWYTSKMRIPSGLGMSKKIIRMKSVPGSLERELGSSDFCRFCARRNVMKVGSLN